MSHGRDDLRLALGWVRHVKTVRLVRLLGYEAPYRLLCLWAYAAENLLDTVPDDASLEVAAGWTGEPGQFAEALRRSGYLDGMTLHDFRIEQKWVFGRLDRIQVAIASGRAGGMASAAARRVRGYGARGADGRFHKPSDQPTPNDTERHRSGEESFGENGDRKSLSCKGSPKGHRTSPTPPPTLIQTLSQRKSLDGVAKRLAVSAPVDAFHPADQPLIRAVRSAGIRSWSDATDITPTWAMAQRAAFAGVDLVAEAKKAAAWALAHQARTARYRCIGRFLHGWFRRAVEGSRRGHDPQERAPSPWAHDVLAAQEAENQRIRDTFGGDYQAYVAARDGGTSTGAPHA